MSCRLIDRRQELKLSEESVRRARLFVGDTYWAEKNYVQSATYYESVVSSNSDVVDLAYYAYERYLDSLIFMKRFDSAIRCAIAELRRRRKEMTAAQRLGLYARLAYAYAEAGRLMKAAIACASMCKLARSEASDELDAISTSVAGWVLYHIDYSDPTIPRTEVHIRDSAALSERPSADQLKEWRMGDPTRTKGTLCVATLFELLGDFRRAEYVYRTAIVAANASCTGDIAGLGVASVCLVRLARIQIRRAKFPEAASTLKAAHECVLQVRMNGAPTTEKRGGSAYALLWALDLGFQGCSDSDIFSIFELVEKQWRGDEEVQAYLNCREGEILFNRQLIQSGRRRFAEAENLANSANCPVLYRKILEEKLFRNPQKFYSDPLNWLRAALDFALSLAIDEVHKDYQNSFAEEVRKLSGAQTVPPFTCIADSIVSLNMLWKVSAFWVAIYAIWKAAKAELIMTSSLNLIESYLKKTATFVTPDDF